MSSEQFTAHYALGIDMLDSEHWKLISAMNVITDAIRANNKAFVQEGCELLLKELRIHCAHEEAYMGKINYPFFKYHRECHVELIKDMSKIVQNITETKPIYNITDALYKVFVTHIDTVDTQISAYVKQQLMTKTHI
jgi:hemerythrin-like metal-binding protein